MKAGPARRTPTSYRIRVDLVDAKPPIWRRLDVGGDVQDAVHDLRRSAGPCTATIDARAPVAQSATVRYMDTVPSRQLRNRTAEVLRKAKGETLLTVTVNGRPVAELTPAKSRRPPSMGRSELAALLRRSQADPGLRDDLTALAGDTTENVGPIQ